MLTGNSVEKETENFGQLYETFIPFSYRILPSSESQ